MSVADILSTLLLADCGANMVEKRQQETEESEQPTGWVLRELLGLDAARIGRLRERQFI
jgi:hypothetical protein